MSAHVCILLSPSCPTAREVCLYRQLCSSKASVYVVCLPIGVTVLEQLYLGLSSCLGLR